MKSEHKQMYTTLSGPEVRVCFVPRGDIIMKEVVEGRLHARQKEMEVVEPSFFGSHRKQRKYSKSLSNTSFIVFF